MQLKDETPIGSKNIVMRDETGHINIVFYAIEWPFNESHPAGPRFEQQLPNDVDEVETVHCYMISILYSS